MGKHYEHTKIHTVVFILIICIMITAFLGLVTDILLYKEKSKSMNSC